MLEYLPDEHSGTSYRGAPTTPQILAQLVLETHPDTVPPRTGYIVTRHTSSPQYRFQTETTPEYLEDLLKRLREALPLSEDMLNYNSRTMDIMQWSAWREEHPEVNSAFALLEAMELISEYRETLIGGSKQ